MPKISQRTAQSGADVADGDLIGIIDVGSPNLDERITVAELAQAPQFSSRYKPLGSDRLWLSAQEFSISVNTPSLGDLGSAGAGNQRTTAWLFDSGVAEAVGGFFMMPVGWATADMFVWWSNAGAGAGDVVWSFGALTLVDTTNSDAAGTLSSSTITAPAQYVVKRSAGPTAITATAGQVVRLMLRREGANAADTLGNDAGLLGVELVRAS